MRFVSKQLAFRLLPLPFALGYMLLRHELRPSRYNDSIFWPVIAAATIVYLLIVVLPLFRSR